MRYNILWAAASLCAAMAGAPCLADDVTQASISIPPLRSAPKAPADRPAAIPRSRPAAGASDPVSGVVRIKNLADWQGVRGNQLVGYGLVVGLEGTGDGQSSQFTIQATVNMLRRFRINV